MINTVITELQPSLESMFPECEFLTGYLKKICRGEVLEPHGPSGHNAYRRHEWNLDPISEQQRASRVSDLSNGSLPLVPRIGGVGTELKLLLSNHLIAKMFPAWFKPLPGCKCTDHAITMDNHGIEWCEKHFDTIIGWLIESAEERKIPRYLPIKRTAVKILKKSINNAKKNRLKQKAKATTKLTKPFKFDGHVPRFVTTADLMRDAHSLASMLPPDTPLIIGMARSGLCVATMVAMILHLPLQIYGQSTATLTDPGNGWRLTGNVGTGAGRPVVIDDTCMTGNSFLHSMPIIRRTHPNALSAAVYVNPTANHKPDLWVIDLPWPHILEWNVPNSVMSPSCALDFDGILCHDCSPGDDDDGPRYLEFLKNVRPLYLTRRTAVPLIVTARLEKYRPQTTEWLARHGVAVDRLIMGPWTNNYERSRACIGTFKGQHFREFLRVHRGIKPTMFFESDVNQARVIAKVSGGLVVCPAARQCFVG